VTAYQRYKRWLDLGLAMVALALFLPLWVLIAFFISSFSS
jgi:lipopolysaccharide/colanic/teichoic acid biosynthesis glycosyltransferase